jgi:predicted Zn-dependent protease
MLPRLVKTNIVPADRDAGISKKNRLDQTSAVGVTYLFDARADISTLLRGIERSSGFARLAPFEVEGFERPGEKSCPGRSVPAINLSAPGARSSKDLSANGERAVRIQIIPSSHHFNPQGVFMARIITSLFLSAVLLWAAVPAQGYIYQYNSGGRQLRWSATTITVAISPTLASANVAGGDAVGAARRALARWSAATNIQFVEVSTGVTATGRDGVNLLTFTPLSVARQGTTQVFSDTATGTIIEADVAINSAYPFSTNGAANTYDLESTLVHEVGHLLGLDHSGVVGATMQPTQGQNITGDPALTMRTLSDDDLAGIRSIYGQRSPFAVGSIAGQVNYGAGAHVWAENFYTGRVAGSSITKSDGSYRIDQLPTSDYRVFVEYLDEPVNAAQIALPPASSTAHPYIGIGRQPAFHATETQTPVNVSAGNTTILNPIITLGAPSFNPRILGINGALQGAPATLSAGRVYRFYVGGSNLATFPLTANTVSVTSPFMTIDPASFTRDDARAYGFSEPNYGIFSFNLVVADNAKFGDYTLRLRSASGEAAYLSGALALDPYTNFVELNPLENNGFFVRRQYLDFLFREPEQDGFNAWLGVLNRCDANPSTDCDRVTVSSSFFRAPEFQIKGFFIYRFYAVAFGRRPNYTEMIPDLQFVTGQTADEVNAKREAFVNAFMQRPAFRNTYDALSNAAYVDTLLRTAGVTLSNRDQLISDLDTQRQTRAQVLRAIVESQAVQNKEFNPAFVAMQYFGYLKRDPEPEGFNAWLAYLNSHANDFRTMVHGFVNSVEYRTRFGQP